MAGRERQGEGETLGVTGSGSTAAMSRLAMAMWAMAWWWCHVAGRKMRLENRHSGPPAPERAHAQMDFDPVAYAHVHARDVQHHGDERMEEDEMEWNADWYEHHRDVLEQEVEDPDDHGWHGYHGHNPEEDWSATGRLREVFPSVDKSKDGKVSMQELVDWIYDHKLDIQKHRAQEEIRWAKIDIWDDRDHEDVDVEHATVSWEEYMESHGRTPTGEFKTYHGDTHEQAIGDVPAHHGGENNPGFEHDDRADPDESKTSPPAPATYDLTNSDRWTKRASLLWKWADKDGDDLLDLEEMREFLKPQLDGTQENARTLLEAEMAYADEDGDERISQEEFEDHLYYQLHDEHSWEDGHRTREEIFDDLDHNGDGFLDRGDLEPVVSMIFPLVVERARTEAKEMMEDADTNHDGMLSLDEMLENVHVFYDPVMGAEDYYYDYHDEL